MMTETSFGDQHSRPTLDEFKHICHTELHWLVTEYGFREVAADAAQSDNPFRVLFVRDDLTVDIEGINYGSHVMFRIRDRHGRSIGVNNLDPAFVPSNKPHKWVEVGQAVEIAHDARRLRALGTPLLEGDLSVFDSAIARAHAVRAAYASRQQFGVAVEKAVAAFRLEQWPRVIELLEPHEAALSPRMARKLATARPHAAASP